MADRTALRLDEQAEADLRFLVEKYGTQTAAMKTALSELARRERLLAEMRTFVDDTEGASGPLTDQELDAARPYFR